MSLAKSRNRPIFFTPQFGKEAQTEHELEIKKKLKRRTNQPKETQKENEPGRYGINGAINNNVGSNCMIEEEAQTKQETEEVEWKRKGMETVERTEQPMGERFPLEQQLAKERVLKEYESGESGVACCGLFRKDADSLPDQPKEGKMEHDQTGECQFEVLFSVIDKRSSFRASLAKSRASI